MKIKLKDERETIELGKKLGILAQPGMLFCMQGDLGAGKTTMTKGIALGIGVSTRVTSPTFTIMKIHQGRIPLYHFDAYRLEGLNQDLGFEEYFDGDGLAVIEWSQYLSTTADNFLNISLKITDEGGREATLTAVGQLYENLLKEIIC